MSKFNGRKILSAVLHETIRIPVTGNLNNNITSKKLNNIDKVIKDLVFWDNVVEITDKGYTTLVPVTGFKSLVLDNESAEVFTPLPK